MSRFTSFLKGIFGGNKEEAGKPLAKETKQTNTGGYPVKPPPERTSSTKRRKLSAEMPKATHPRVKRRSSNGSRRHDYDDSIVNPVVAAVLVHEMLDDDSDRCYGGGDSDCNSSYDSGSSDSSCGCDD